MTLERAIEILNPEHREHYESIEPVNEACRMGMKALEKQIPKKPKLKIFEDIDEETGKNFYPRYYLCAMCGGLIGAKHNKHCSNCGQALDWSDTE